MCLGKATGVREPEEKKMSLLKQKTNNDRINEMSVEEKAEFFSSGDSCILCSYCNENGCEKINSSNPNDCINGIKQWLESEAEV